MVKCDKCGIETYMPFRCNYCGGYYCEQHRLPEFHDCTGAFNAPRNTVQFGNYSSTSNSSGSYSTTRIMRPYWFSKRELRDITIGILVITIVPLLRIWSLFFDYPLIIVGYTVILLLAFILHELAHKFMAQKLGMWAEFRLSSTGLILTVLSFLLVQSGAFPLMIVAPGAVMVAGMLNWNDYGRISIVGPATNIAQALIYLLIYVISPSTIISVLTVVGMAVNSGLALFNLIPFGLFDGTKIFRWNWKAWLAAVIASGAIFVFVWIF